jgi:hypothetical protein
MNKICVVENIRYFDMPTEEIIAKYFLVEVEEDFNIGDQFRFQGKFYSLSCKRPKENLIIVKEIKLKYPIDECIAEDNIKCPYCGCENTDSWEVSDNSGEEICEDCGSTFVWNRDTRVTYNSAPLKQKEIIGLNQTTTRK